MLSKTGLLVVPKGLAILNRGSFFEITQKWFNPVLFLPVAAVAIYLFFDCFANWDEWLARNEWIRVSVELVMGIGFAYSALASLFNRTSIILGAGKLVVRHGPIPWIGNTELAIPDIKQFYSKRKSPPGRRGPISFEVRLITQGGKDLRVVGRLESQEHAFTIEQAIEQQLGIKDVYVGGGIWNDATHYPSQRKSSAKRSDA